MRKELLDKKETILLDMQMLHTGKGKSGREYMPSKEMGEVI